MNYYEVAPIQIVRTGCDFFTYSSNIQLHVGTVVTVETGNKKTVGVIINKTSKPKYATKPIINTLTERPLPKQLIGLSLWMSKYYATTLAQVLQSILPNGIDKSRRHKIRPQTKITKRQRTNYLLNSDQKYILQVLEKNSSGTFLLQGITGSGKTEIYINIAKKSIAIGKSVVVLTPEIALTPQLVSEFSNHFDDLLVTHSRMSESLRHLVWSEALNSSTPRVVIGPRSALFMPLKNIGAIIIDESHEPSYKQDQAPKYSALRAATILGRLHGARVILGSATPNILDRYLAETHSNPILKLDKIAKSASMPPSVTVVDMTKRSNFSNHRFFSKQLLEQIQNTLLLKKQVLIYHNRRGSTSTTLCKNCSWTAICGKCYIPLTLHIDQHSLKCHICGSDQAVPNQCPDCSSADVIHKGIGTKLIEFELKKLFPNANIARFDADNTNQDAIHSRYDDLYNNKIDIIIGTQIIAKGLDLPHLRTVCVVQADSGLALPDYSTNERVFQLITQVIGRVGRNEHQTQVVIQTYQPNHYAIADAIAQNYESFYEKTLLERKKGLFPPFVHLLQLVCTYKTEANAIKKSKELAITLKSNLDPSTQIFGPTPCFYERSGVNYRWQIVVKSKKREHLIDAISLLPAKNWQFELDPTSLL